MQPCRFTIMGQNPRGTMPTLPAAQQLRLGFRQIHKPKLFPLPVINRFLHDDVIKWKHFLRYWPFVWGIHRSPVNSPHKGQWRGALMFSLICGRTNGWVNNRDAGDLRRYCAHDDVTVMIIFYATMRLIQLCPTCNSKAGEVGAHRSYYCSHGPCLVSQQYCWLNSRKTAHR